MAISGQSLEQIPANEPKFIEDLGERLKAKIIRDNAGGMMRRDAHPKMHGLVQAEFIVEHGLPEELAVGIFSVAKSYPTWVRFSNQDGSINPDSQNDIRGMALKLMQVPGEKLLAEEKDAQTQDFIVISTDVFVTKDVEEFDGLIKALVGGGGAKLLYFLTHWRVVRNLLKSMKRFASPLQIRYFSTTPYLLGDRAVKYSAIPHVVEKATIPTKPSDNYLREAMVEQLDKSEALFDFCVQFQGDPKQMPVEDPGKLWDERLSPFRKVATLKIAQQTFDSPQRNERGENLSFTPWHALPEHRPLGGVNRARKIIYDLISKFRHKENDQPRNEPSGFDD